MAEDQTLKRKKDDQRSMVYDIMSYAITRGAPIYPTLEFGATISGDHEFSCALRLTNDEICRWSDFASAMKKCVFPFHDYEIEALDKGEESGRLDVAMRDLAKKLKSGYWKY